jgi:hypothetical protein
VIPSEIASYPLIRVCRPDCRSHSGCTDPGKRPVTSVNNPQSIPQIKNWIRSGGNYGIVPKSNNDLLILDSDSELFEKAVRDQLDSTFTIKTGSGNYHFYYRSNSTLNESIKDEDKTEFGSIRSENWHGVGPGSTHPETDQKYTVANGEKLAWVSSEDINNLYQSIHNQITAGEDGPRGAAPPSSPSKQYQKHAKDLETELTQKTLNGLGFIKSDSHRKRVAKVIDHDHPPRHIRVWMGGFLYSSCGLSRHQIERLLEELASWATDSDRIEIEVRSLVETSVDTSQADESVNLDRWLDLAESPDEPGIRGVPGEGKAPEESMTDFKEAEEALAKESSAEGATAVKAVKVEGNDNGDTFEFVSVRRGSLRKRQTADGDTALIVDIDDTDGSTVGSPNDLDTIIEALESLSEKIDS